MAGHMGKSQHDEFEGISSDDSSNKAVSGLLRLTGVAVTPVLLKLIHKVGVVALAVMFASLPVMACAVPNLAVTPAERECCKKMAEHCGDMGMAKSHPCCQETATPADFHALKTASSQLNHVSFVLFHALPVTCGSPKSRAPQYKEISVALA